MNPFTAAEAAALLWRHWQATTRIDALPASCRPATRADGYAIQAELARQAGQATFGWKIAATSVAGQKHIAVDGPLAGRLLAGRTVALGQPVPLGDNLMRVAEAEFAFRMRSSLPGRPTPYSVEEAVAAVDTLHPAIEIPDSRYRDFTVVGAPQLIADMACACWFVLGPATLAPWRERDLAQHPLTARRNGEFVAEGRGSNALGDPRIALAWIANELPAYGEHLRAGDVVTTGTCVVPFALAPGDRAEVDFGDFGRVEVAIA